jgi:hypothetical protein
VSVCVGTINCSDDKECIVVACRPAADATLVTSPSRADTARGKITPFLTKNISVELRRETKTLLNGVVSGWGSIPERSQKANHEKFWTGTASLQRLTWRCGEPK